MFWFLSAFFSLSCASFKNASISSISSDCREVKAGSPPFAFYPATCPFHFHPAFYGGGAAVAFGAAALYFPAHTQAPGGAHHAFGAAAPPAAFGCTPQATCAAAIHFARHSASAAAYARTLR